MNHITGPSFVFKLNIKIQFLHENIEVHFFDSKNILTNY